MRLRELIVVLACVVVSGAPAIAQPADAGAVYVDPETGARYREGRPDPGPRRGEWQVPGWVVLIAGGVVAAGAAGALVRRAWMQR